jgi:hypothetical protein
MKFLLDKLDMTSIIFYSDEDYAAGLQNGLINLDDYIPMDMNTYFTAISYQSKGINVKWNYIEDSKKFVIAKLIHLGETAQQSEEQKAAELDSIRDYNNNVTKVLPSAPAVGTLTSMYESLETAAYIDKTENKSE